jgi:uncharacterized protein YjiS (DUF1127 family)
MMRGSVYVDAPRNAERSQGGAPASTIAVTLAFRLRLGLWRSRVRSRRALARMSERELADIGVSWSQIAEEVSKPFWRA